jgi:DNA-binding response OmpR family regulator
MPKVKTIIYSGMMNEIKELNLEIDSFLFKPLEFDSLLKVVRFLLFEYDGENIKQA